MNNDQSYIPYFPACARALRHAAVLAAICLTADICAGATQGFRRFHEGNSLTDPLTARNIGLRSMATNAGFSKDTVAQVIIAGTPIDWAWENRRASFIAVLTNGGFDFIILQPFRVTQLSSYFEREAIAAAQVNRLALDHSPNSTLVIYHTWLSVTTNNPNVTFVNGMRGVTNYLEYFMDVMEQEFPGRPVLCVPASAAFLQMAQDIETGAGPAGIPSITNLFDPIAPGGNSSIHPTVNGYWLSCLVHFNSYYSEYYTTRPDKFLNMPTNIPFTIYWQGSNDATWTQWPALTSNQAAYMQALAWHVVTNYPRTFLSGVPREKSDRTPPSTPADLRITTQLADRVNIAWNASTDNVAFLRYTIMINRDFYNNTTATTATVMLTNVWNPSNIVVTVRAWDTAYNFSDAHVLVIPEAPLLALLAPLAVCVARRRARGAQHATISI